MKYEEDHDYPFYGTKHLDPIGINVDPVQMRSKMVADFEKIDKLHYFNFGFLTSSNIL